MGIVKSALNIRKFKIKWLPKPYYVTVKLVLIKAPCNYQKKKLKMIKSIKIHGTI